MSVTTTAVITFIDAAGNKASVFQAHNGHPSGPEGVLMALRPLRHAGCGFDAGKMAAHYIGTNWEQDGIMGLYVCRKPKQVDARFRYRVFSVVEGVRDSLMTGTFVACHERDERCCPLFVIPFDDNIGLTHRATRKLVGA